MTRKHLARRRVFLVSLVPTNKHLRARERDEERKKEKVK